MNEMMNSIDMRTPIEVALGVDEEGMTTARKLYDFLGLAQGQFSRWAKANITDNGFATENEDWWGFDIDVEGNTVKDYRLTAHFAKKLSVKGNSEKAEQAITVRAFANQFSDLRCCSISISCRIFLTECE